MSHPYYEVSREEQREILKNLSVKHSNDYVSAINELKSKLGKDHSHTDKVGEVNMSLNDFVGAIKPHYQGHLVHDVVQKVTKQNINLNDF
jgi:hypothetical protein